MASRYTTLVPSLGLRIGLAYEAGLSAGMQRERVPPHRRKKERRFIEFGSYLMSYTAVKRAFLRCSVFVEKSG